jgi:RNA polymerase sigma factor (sigma-70 family)
MAGTDHELLREYADAGSQSAFAELVNSYTPLVYSAARRQVGGDPHLAGDVTQAVFLVLARKAAQIRPQIMLSAWLMKTTRYAASVAMRGRRRRRHHEQQAAAMRGEIDRARSGSPLSGIPGWESVEPLLDEAIARLGHADRSAILLRYFQHKSLREVGQHLRVSEDTAQKRVARAVQRLGDLLRERGVEAGTATGLAMLVGAHAVQAAPAGMAAQVLAVASGQAAAPAAAAISAAVVQGSLSMAGKIAIAAVLLTTTVIALVLTQMGPRQRQFAAPPVQPVAADPLSQPTVLLGPALGPASLDLGDGVTLELIGIPPAEFTKGDEIRRPAHRVRIPYGYYIGKYEVTQGQWVRVMESNPSAFHRDPRNPVEHVNWHDCEEFCRRLSLATGRIVRLPSESEWEHACRAGTSTVWHFGDDPNELDKYAWHNITTQGDGPIALRLAPAAYPIRNSGGRSRPVGQKLPNPWGLYDMHGNVWEWCQDVGHHSDRYDNYPRDGSPASFAGAADARITRGGGWGSIHLNETFSAFRFSHPPEHTSGGLGFRIVVELDPQAGRL